MKLRKYIIILIYFTASFTVISAKAVSGMIQLTFAGHMQLNQAIFYAFAVVMLFTGIVQVKYVKLPFFISCSLPLILYSQVHTIAHNLLLSLLTRKIISLFPPLSIFLHPSIPNFLLSILPLLFLHSISIIPYQIP